MLKKIIIISGLTIISVTTGIAETNHTFNQPVLLHADDMSFDKRTNEVKASGHVEVYQEKEVLTCDQLTYNRTLDKMTATGNVVWQKESGDVFFGASADLQNQMKDGVIREIRGILSDQAKLAANKGTRRNGTETQLDQAVYSTCPVCRTEPNKPPLWQIKAETVLWDEQSHDIIYTDAWLEFLGIPSLYTPYLTHPDPSVKQRSGIIPPIQLNNSKKLGFYTSVPYYYVISPDKDITLAPLITSKKGQFLIGTYRQRFSSALLELGGSYGYSKKHVGSPPNRREKDAWRGHIDSSLDWDVNDTWRIKANVLRSTGKTYLREFPFYGHQNDAVLKSRAQAEGFYGLSYARMMGMLYQVQRRGEHQRDTPIVAPDMLFSYVSPTQLWGSRFYADVSSLVLSRQNGTNVQRISATTVWKLPFASPIGDRYNFSLRARGDGYHYNNFEKFPGAEKKNNEGRGRFFPQAFLEWEYPWINVFSGGNFIISPMASLVAAPKVGDQVDIPNEDSNAIEPNDEYLLSHSRILGLDRIDDGSRANYGFKFDTRTKSGLRGNAFIGQTASFSKPNSIFRGTGFEHTMSDYMGRIGFSFNQYFTFRYRFRLDKDSLSGKRHEFSASAGVPVFKVNMNYLKRPVGSQTASGPATNQLTLGVTSEFVKNWTLNLSTIQDVGSHAHALAYIAGIMYNNECLMAGLEMRKTFYHDGADLKPDQAFMFVLAFKNAGGDTLFKLNHKTSLKPTDTNKQDD